MKKILIDTDIGDDIDDALAITLAFGLKAEVVGITTAFLNTQLRARQANKLLELLGAHDVPVYAGCGDSLEKKNDTERMICQYTPDLVDARFLPENPGEGAEGQAAVDFIIEMADQYKEELTIVGLAPMTNIARAIRKAPESMKKVGRIVLMAGSFFEQFIEWNVLCDPEAAKVVLGFDVPVYCLGTDVTVPCTVTEEEYQRMIAGGSTPLAEYLSDVVKKWVSCSGRIPILHDPLAVYAAVAGKYIEYEEHTIDVELGGTYCRGLTLNLDNVYRYEADQLQKRRIFVGKNVDAAAFKQDFFKIVFGAE